MSRQVRGHEKGGPDRPARLEARQRRGCAPPAPAALATLTARRWRA
ncbi:hypothetical protein [Lysobacter gummosus]